MSCSKSSNADFLSSFKICENANKDIQSMFMPNFFQQSIFDLLLKGSRNLDNKVTN